MAKSQRTTSKGDTRTTTSTSKGGHSVGKTDYRSPGNSQNNKTTHFKGNVQRSRTNSSDKNDHQSVRETGEVWDVGKQEGNQRGQERGNGSFGWIHRNK